MAEIKARPDPITVTPNAARRIRAALDQEGRPTARLRITVSGGGCSGFRYNFALDEGDEPGDIVIEAGDATVVVDDMSLMYVLGSELDYVEDLTGSYFRMRNPNATAGCGCGNSFAI
jgi:iron-sulfur cluster insertion protein